MTELRKRTSIRHLAKAACIATLLVIITLSIPRPTHLYNGIFILRLGYPANFVVQELAYDLPGLHAMQSPCEHPTSILWAQLAFDLVAISLIVFSGITIFERRAERKAA